MIQFPEQNRMILGRLVLVYTNTMTKLLFVRHGITDENLKYQLIGTTDVPLGQTGMAQANRLADALASIPIGLMITSPLLRTKQTATQIIQRHEHIPFQTDRNLQEIHLGTFDGMDSFQAYEQSPGILDLALDETTSDFAFPGGELRSHALARFKLAIDSLVTSYPQETICVVTHGGLLGLWFADLNQQKLGAFRKYQPKHASLTIVEWTGSLYKTIRFNDCTHLQ